MDTAGAMLGPLLAFGLLALAPLALRRRLPRLASASRSLGVGVLVLLVRDPRADGAPRRRRPRAGACAASRGCCAVPALPRAARSPAALLGLATISDALPLPRAAAQRSTSRRATSRCSSSAPRSSSWSSPCPSGRLADRIGRGRVFLGGYVLLLGVYALLLLGAELGVRGSCSRARRCSAPSTRRPTACCWRSAGAPLPEELRGSGLGLLDRRDAASRALRGARRLRRAVDVRRRLDAAVAHCAGSRSRSAIVVALAVVLRSTARCAACCVAARGRARGRRGPLLRRWRRRRAGVSAVLGQREHDARRPTALGRAGARRHVIVRALDQTPGLAQPAARARSTRGGRLAQIAPRDRARLVADLRLRARAAGRDLRRARRCAHRARYVARSCSALTASVRAHARRSTGVPSRARVSPDGRYGATTTFVTGDSLREARRVLDRRR